MLASMDLNQIDLNLLVALDALLAERSVTRAANRLSVGQSAMSSTLGRLRKLMSDPILVRDGRAMVATPLAQALEQPVRDALARIESVLAAGRGFDPMVDQRSFTVVSSDYVAISYLHPLLVRFVDAAPHVRFHLRQVGSDFEDLLRRNQVDLVIVPREVFPNFREFRNQELFVDDWVCVADAAHPDIGDAISLDQFVALPYLAIRPAGRPSSASMQLDLLGVEHRTEFTVGLGVAPFLLTGTRLVTLIPNRLARRFQDIANLRILEPPMALPPITETMVWTKRNDDDPGHRWLRAEFEALAGSLVAREQPA